MIICNMDPLATGDCMYCCIYCSEKKTCENSCEVAKLYNEENLISAMCTFAYEEEMI